MAPFLFPKNHDSTTVLNARRLDQLTRWPELVSDLPPGPRFTYFHIILPHPPLHFTPECDVTEDPDPGGTSLQPTGGQGIVEERRQAWIEQLQCVNDRVLVAIATIPGDEIIIVASDHGPDSIYPLHGDVAGYTDAALAERMPVLLATRLLPGCQVAPADLDLVNVFRVVLTCISANDIPLIESRHFVAGFTGPIIEVELSEP